eukprot:TRINITY_DN9527_c0_g1_i1.p1 TRINITY_DN9527_c0_g1~~TRINITY_DN9527_c0_g1_i1.p1  ORF type:complete len:106 (+),score=16.86 TRINITY_DN9527_c0_g1_i1:161-478(+)
MFGVYLILFTMWISLQVCKSPISLRSVLILSLASWPSLSLSFRYLYIRRERLCWAEIRPREVFACSEDLAPGVDKISVEYKVPSFKSSFISSPTVFTVSKKNFSS